MALKQFRLPDVGEGLTEGEILQWLVATGDTVVVNQPIVEVETAKAAVELPCPYAGVVTELLYEPGSTVDVGAPIITIETEPGSAGATTPQPRAAVDSASGDAGPGGLPPSEETLAEVHVAGEDEPVEPGLIGGPAPGGRTAVLVGYGPRTTVAKRRPRRTSPRTAAQVPGPQPQEGSAPLLATAPDVDSKPVRHGGIEMGRAAEAHAAGDPEEAASSVTVESRGTKGGRAKAKPPVRKYAKSLGIDIATVAGSGPEGSVTRADIDAHSDGGFSSQELMDEAVQHPGEAVTQSSSAGSSAYGSALSLTARPDFDPATREQRIPIKGVRKHTAAAMVSSAFTAPHVTEWVTVDVTRMMALRGRLAARPEFREIRTSPLLFVAQALLLAVRKHPMINSSWDEAAQEIVVKEYVNLGIAAATPRGLIVPNIKDAGALSMTELAGALADLTETARSGRTSPADMSGGTITVTNVGVFGVDTGTPILNPGESAILAVGTIAARPWVHKGKVKVRQVTTLGLSFDHRVVDGELGSRFLADLAALLHDPGLALAC
ncbi:MAG: 2-oxo acid dehydrogenase subunit E2 [Actinomycetota bacterium]|nr:2-oxo acid dehydrogenase subunit E2 [Actinomycetota bacterium]